MGFYIRISIELEIDQTTGKPILDQLANVEIPKKYRRFLDEKGKHYIRYVVDDDRYIDSASSVYNNFPTWENIYEDLSNEEKANWTEPEHNLLKEAMKWFSEQEESYTIHWG